MICKWCGSTIQNIDTKCAACGRETPPMSDCGGFYNLKVGDGTQPPVVIQKIVYRDVIVKETPKWVKPALCVMLAGVLVLGGTVGVQFKVVSNAKNKIEVLTQQQTMLTEQNAELIEKTAEPILAQQMCSLNISLENSSVSVNLGEYVDTLTTSLISQSSEVVAEVSLKQADTNVQIETEKTYNVAAVSLYLDEAAFGEKDSVMCRWMTEDGTVIVEEKPKGDRIKTVLRKDQIPNEYESLTCEIVHTNKDGGQITVCVNQIQFDETGKMNWRN